MQLLSMLTKTDLATLVETARELAAEVSLAALLRRILDTATQLTDSTGSSIVLFREKRNALYVAHATGPDAATVLVGWGETSEQGIPLEGSKAGEVFTSGRSLIVNAVGQDPNHFRGVDRDTGTPTASMVCVPMRVAGQGIGVVQIINKRTGDYGKRDLFLLEHFAAQAAIAIRNARLFDDLLAHMGLYASRHTNEGPLELLEELNRPAHTEVLSVLFADMRSFTQLCHVEGRPERTQQILNEFLAMLADAVIDHQGLVNKFLGDGLMALFRGTDHAPRAIECAAAMLENFTELRARWDERSNVPLGFLDLGIGIATDSVILGALGSDRVRDFTAVGTAVNLAAHLMEHARGGRRILVDKMTYRAAASIIGEYEGPEAFEFKKPGQAVGHPYERYHIKRLRTDSGFSASLGPPMANARPAPSHDVFISYSHKDKHWLEKLRVHLKPYLRGGLMNVWSDIQMQPGDRWRDEIGRALAQARVAVLLVSPHFLDSDFIAANELPPLLAAAEDRGLRIVWVPLSASSYHVTEIRHYQAALDPARPLDSLSDAEQNQALVAVCEKIKAATTG